MIMKRILLAALAACVAGCGHPDSTDKPNVELKTVTGKILVGGKPAAGARITLHPRNASSLGHVTPGGEAREDGKFVITTWEFGDGLPVGSYRASVSWSDVLNPNSSDPMYGPEKIPRRFQKPETSGIEIEVTPEMTELPPIQITSR